MIEDLTPVALAALLRTDDPPLLVDVREDWERELAAIPGSHHIPMHQIPARLDELDRDRPLVLQCHHGARSLQVARWLATRGYRRIANLDGGIDAWSVSVDPGVRRYS